MERPIAFFVNCIGWFLIRMVFHELYAQRFPAIMCRVRHSFHLFPDIICRVRHNFHLFPAIMYRVRHNFPLFPAILFRVRHIFHLFPAIMCRVRHSFQFFSRHNVSRSLQPSFVSRHNVPRPRHILVISQVTQRTRCTPRKHYTRNIFWLINTVEPPVRGHLGRKVGQNKNG